MNQFEEFEKACAEIDDRDFDLAQENVIYWLKNRPTATVTFTQGKFISKIRTLAEKYPEKVKITAENKDGSIVAQIPVKAVKLNIVEREISDEERAALRERLQSYRKNTDGVGSKGSNFDFNSEVDIL